MKGTEKQIEWATKLTEKMEKEFAAYLELAPASQRDEGQKIIDKIVNLTKEAYAGDVIDLLKSNNEVCARYYMEFFTAMKVSGNGLAMQLKKEVFSK